MNRLISRRVEAVDVLGWMCPKTAAAYKGGFSGRLFDALASDDAVFAHIQQPLAAGAGPVYPAANPAALAA